VSRIHFIPAGLILECDSVRCAAWVSSGLTLIYKTRLEKFICGKRSSLFSTKSSIKLDWCSGAIVIKLYS
jgi:hypothetical protein